MKTITSIASFELIERLGKEAVYECLLACGCRERHRYIDMEPHVGGWAECSYGIVDSETSSFCNEIQREQLKRSLHDGSQPQLQAALAALLYAYRHRRMKSEKRIPPWRPMKR